MKEKEQIIEVEYDKKLVDNEEVQTEFNEDSFEEMEETPNENENDKTD